MNRAVLNIALIHQENERRWRVKATMLARRLGNNKRKSEHTIHRYTVGLVNARYQQRHHYIAFHRLKGMI